MNIHMSADSAYDQMVWSNASGVSLPFIMQPVSGVATSSIEPAPGVHLRPLQRHAQSRRRHRHFPGRGRADVAAAFPPTLSPSICPRLSRPCRNASPRSCSASSRWVRERNWPSCAPFRPSTASRGLELHHGLQRLLLSSGPRSSWLFGLVLLLKRRKTRLRRIRRALKDMPDEPSRALDQPRVLQERSSQLVMKRDGVTADDIRTIFAACLKTRPFAVDPEPRSGKPIRRVHSTNTLSPRDAPVE